LFTLPLWAAEPVDRSWPIGDPRDANDPNDPNDPNGPKKAVVVHYGYAFDSNAYPPAPDPNQRPKQVTPPSYWKSGGRYWEQDPRWPNQRGFWGISGGNETFVFGVLVSNTLDGGEEKHITVKFDIKANDPNDPLFKNSVTCTGRPPSGPPRGSGHTPPAPTKTPGPNGSTTYTYNFVITPQPKSEWIYITLKTGSNGLSFIFMDNLDIKTECKKKDREQETPQEPPPPDEKQDKSQSHYYWFETPAWPPPAVYTVLPAWYEDTFWDRFGSFPPVWLPGITDHEGVYGLPGGFVADGQLAVHLDDQPEPVNIAVEYVAYQFDFYNASGGGIWWEPVMPPECVIVNAVEELEELENGWQRAHLTFEVMPPPAWQELHWSMFTDGRGGPVGIDHVVMSGSTWWVDYWSDQIDFFTVGAGLHGQYDWRGWDNNPLFDGLVTELQGHSLFNAVEIGGPADLVQPFDGYISREHVFTAWQYVPGDFQSHCDSWGNCGSYLLLLNTYHDGGPYHWSVQLHADSITGAFIRDQQVPVSLPLITDRWVQIDVLIDLDADLYRVYYDGVQLGEAASWSAGVNGQGGGAVNLAALDLYANASSPVFYDDFYLRRTFPGDTDCNGWVDFDDINPFVLAVSDPGGYMAVYPTCTFLNGDCNNDGLVDFDDINPFVVLLSGE
jgi:hypothetical protein